MSESGDDVFVELHSKCSFIILMTSKHLLMLYRTCSLIGVGGGRTDGRTDRQAVRQTNTRHRKRITANSNFSQDPTRQDGQPAAGPVPASRDR